MNLAQYCEVTPELLTKKASVKRTKLPEVETYTLSQFHKDLDEAPKGSKKATISILCKMLSTHGDFANFAENYPEAYKRLQEMRK